MYKSRGGGRKGGGGVASGECSEAKKTDASEKDSCLLEPSLAGSAQKPRLAICIFPLPLSSSFPFSIKQCKAYCIACHNLLYTLPIIVCSISTLWVVNKCLDLETCCPLHWGFANLSHLSLLSEWDVTPYWLDELPRFGMLFQEPVFE